MDNNERILGIKEIQRLYEINERQREELQENLKKISDDMQIRSMSMEMCKLKEKDIDIKGQDDDTVEDKRFRIKGAENERTPYTLEILRKRLDEMVGEDRVKINISNQTVQAKIALESKKSFSFVNDMLDQIIPLDMLIETEIMWNSHNTLAAFTHQFLSTKKHIEIKEEKL